MFRSLCLISCLWIWVSVQAQGDPVFPKSVLGAQFAGSTGLVSAGFAKVSARERVELGLVYGYLPKAYGGVNHSLSLKFTYNPFQLRLWKRLSVEPLQLGAFVCQNFNRNLDLFWGNKYPKNYYWWPRSTRFHPFVSAQAGYIIGRPHLDRLMYYFEVNTNDLYIASFFPNQRALGLYDILFFGMGLKLYLR